MASHRRSHELDMLASEANLDPAEMLLDLQPIAVGTRHQIGDFKRPGDRARIQEELQLLADKLLSAIARQAKN